MKTIEDLLSEWREYESICIAYMRGERKDTPVRSQIEIARDILALAGEQKPGRVIIFDELVDNPIIEKIAGMIAMHNDLCRFPMTVKTAPHCFRGQWRTPYKPTQSDVDWASLPLPC